MSKLNSQYGSELHLLRWMGRHRTLFDKKVCKAMGISNIKWLDFQFDPGAIPPDAEWKDIQFLENLIIKSDYDQLKKRWKDWWPTGGNTQNWDAAGKYRHGDKDIFVVVEAKATIQECKSDCGARSKDSIKKIEYAFLEVQSSLKINPKNSWMKKYYQKANRLAFLHFLEENKIECKLLDILFTGDDNKQAGRKGVASIEEWNEQKVEELEHLGLKNSYWIQNHYYQLVLSI